MKNNKTKYFDSTWDFKNANTKTYTHCYHSYPAMMIPQVARRLIGMYGKNSIKLFDPYCGTGTSLVEANLKNINAVGTDLNPLAQLIAKAKTSKINVQILDLYLKEFNDFYFALNYGLNKSNFVIPDFKNIDYWFSKEIQEKLAIIKEFIEKISDPGIKNFFLVAFSETVRDVSFTRNSEFKLYRMSERQLELFTPDAFSGMINRLARNKKGLIEFMESMSNKEVFTEIYGFNTVNEIKKIEENSVDLIVTSPPYGDSRTTVAYGQFSRLANQWLEIDNANHIDKKLLGGESKDIKKIGIKIADETIEKVAEKDIKRAKEVYSFYIDYLKSIHNVSKVLKSRSYACYVVGNRKVKGIILPTDEITKSFFENQNFIYENTFIRNIPNKRMPKRNSPSNTSGVTEETMSKEFIVVMKKH